MAVRKSAQRQQVFTTGPLLIALALLFAAQPLLAADRGAMAATIAAQAGDAFKSGNFSRAAELFFNAWKSDPKTEYLWSLARSEHLAGHHTQALEHYRAFLAAPGAMADRVERAEEYVAAIGRLQSAERADEAGRAAMSGEPGLAATLYLQAFELDRNHMELLYKAAVALQEDRDWVGAERRFSQYLATAPALAAQRAQAEARLAIVRRKMLGEPAPAVAPAPPAPLTVAAPTADPSPAPAPPVQVAAPPPAPPAPPPAAAAPLGVEQPKPAPAAAFVPAPQPQVAATPEAGGGLRAAGWALTGTGAALALAAGGVFVWARLDQARYDQSLARAADGRIYGTSEEAAIKSVNFINNRITAAIVGGGVGVAALAIGVGFLASGSSSAAIGPGPGEAGVAVTWRY